MTTKYQRQWTEFEAIKSIYEKEFEEIKFPWKVDHPPWFKINLPAGIVLEVRMTKVYPDGIPELRLSSKAAELKEKLTELEGKLVKEASGLVGSEMCFDLIESAREFCDRLAKKGKISFHSEMLKTKEEKNKEAMDIQAIQLQKDEEILLKQRRAEMEEMEKRIREELREKLVVSSSSEPPDHCDYKRNNSLNIHNNNYSSCYLGDGHFTFDPAILVDDGIEVKSVSTMSTSAPNNSITSTKSKVKSDDGKVFSLRAIPLIHPFLQTFGGRRQLEVLLKQLKNHPLKGNESVSRCFGGSIDKQNHRMLLLYEEEEDKINLNTVLEQSGGFSLQRTIEYLKQVCFGLIHLHSAGITHRSLDLSSLHLTASGRRLKIEDYLVRKCLLDLSREHAITFDGYEPEIVSWEAPEMISRPNFHGKKVDIWAIGRLAIQMLFSPEILRSYASYTEFAMSPQAKQLPENLREFLDGCLNCDSAKRMTAEELIKCKIFTETEAVAIDNLLLNVVRNNNHREPCHHITGDNPSTSNNNSNSQTSQTSRYLTDFEELEFLGRGGFGSVVKVRNKIDDRFYAVKKIALDPRDIEYNKKILREVTTLSRLHHERIIRYYQAWIEDAFASDSGSDSASDESDYYTDTDAEKGIYKMTDKMSDCTGTRTKTQRKIIDLSLGPKSFEPFKGLIDDGLGFDDFDGEEDDCSECSEISDDFIRFEGGTETTVTLNTNDTTESSGLFTGTITTLSSSKSARGQVLYIQMEYCPNQTLRDLIDERNSDPTGHFLDSPEIWRLFRQIVEGLVHIHAQGMMHRDLKPSNIFLDSNGDVKIGDFGLAVTRMESTITGRCESPSKPGGGNDKSFTGESHTQNIGTPFYVSPEQLGSTSAARYNQKVDMYSLGIILIELWSPFQTGMERVQSLQKCRLPEMILPGGLEENVLKIGKKLLCHDAKKRFTSLELLRSDLLPPMLEEELMEDAMRSVAQPQAAHFPRLISTIFKRVSQVDPSQLKAKDFAFDVHSGNATELGICEEAAKMKKELIERVFVKHGAIEINPPLLYLPLGPSEPQAYAVLDDAGQRLELPSNLTRPFARWVAQSSLQVKSLKRYSVDRVFRKISQVSGGQPYQPNEAAFDIIDSEDEFGLLGFSEVVRVAFDSIRTLCPNLRSELLAFKINNLKLRKYFIGNEEKLMKLLNPVKIDEPCDALIQRLRASSPDLRDLLDELTVLLRYLQRVSVPPKVKIVFDPLLSGPRPELHESDLVFVVVKDTGKRGGVNETLCCGGRYNQLIEEYKFPTARLEGRGPFGVGVSLFLDNFPANTTTTSSSSKKTTKNGMLLTLANGECPSNEELWLIGEIWRVGRGSNLTIITAKNAGNSNTPANHLQIQVKSNSGRVRVKLGREVEEFSLEEFPAKLEANELNWNWNWNCDQVNMVSDSQDLDQDHEDTTEASNSIPVHYVLTNQKSERANPILREKAMKAVKQVATAVAKSLEVLIHELPRELVGKLLYDPAALTATRTTAVKMGEEQREQVQRMNQFIGKKQPGSLLPKVMVLYNHKDNQTDLLYIK